MNKLLMILLFFLIAVPGNAAANAKTAERIATIEAKASDFRHQEENCSIMGDQTVCASILYRYEVDEQGRLYFVEVTAYEAKDSASSPPPGTSESTLICQLDSTLKCREPELRDQTLDLSAYAASDEGVGVHDKINPWTDPQKAGSFLSEVQENVGIARQTEARMMDNLACYMFHFGEVVNEFKLNGRLIDDDSVRLLQPEACLTSFRDICKDPGSRSDQLKLASGSRIGNPETEEKIEITARDVDRFCNFIRPMKSAMLR